MTGRRSRSLAAGFLINVPCALLMLSSIAANAAASAVTELTSGSVGIRLVDIPTSAAGDPRARLYIVDRLARGAVIHRRIAISVTSGTHLPETGSPIVHAQVHNTGGRALDVSGSMTLRSGLVVRTASAVITFPRRRNRSTSADRIIGHELATTCRTGRRNPSG